MKKALKVIGVIILLALVLLHQASRQGFFNSGPHHIPQYPYPTEEELRMLGYLEEVLLGFEDVSMTHNAGYYMSIVIQGVESLDIYDTNGNRLLQQSLCLYRQSQSGVLERVGEVIPINMETLRFQYVLDADEYVFKNINFSDAINAEILVLTYENWMSTSQVLYSNFDVSNHMELHVSLALSQLSDIVTNTNVEPSEIASEEDIRQWNDLMTNHAYEQHSY